MNTFYLKHGRMIPLAAALALAGCAVSTAGSGTSSTATTTTTTTSNLIANLTAYANATGTAASYTTAGSVDPSGVFFQALGTNTRTCATCHQLDEGMSRSATSIQALFTSTAGADPIFDAVDGANCPTVATGDQSGHSLILNNGLIRIPITLPATTQFTLTVVQDPYGCALTKNVATGTQTVSVYRRPLPTSSIVYLNSVMWDARETINPLTAESSLLTNLGVDLTNQAQTAVATHEQGSVVPTATQTNAMIAFMEGLFTAQTTDSAAGSLTANGATGGPLALAAVNYYPGINDAFGGDPTGAVFNPAVFNLYNSWANSTNAAQASIARGEKLFDSAPLTIATVRGINDNTALGSPQQLPGTCTTCHDAPNLGHHSAPLPMDTAISRLAQFETDPGILGGLAQLSPASLPVYELTGCTDVNNKPVTYYTSDPGKALTTGLCADVNRMKVPMLRALAARAPYFHNGSASSLKELVAFYNARFKMGLNPQQQTDLVNFLSAL